MPNELPDHHNTSATWSPKLVYGLAGICLLLGLLVGYFVRGSAGDSMTTVGQSKLAEVQAGFPQGHPTPALEQMKQMADKQAEPLLSQLKKNSRDKETLLRAAYVYKSAHQFQDAANYFRKALEVNPKDVAIRTERASCLYYNGDVDGALGQLQQSLQYQPRDANSLFNLGMAGAASNQSQTGSKTDRRADDCGGTAAKGSTLVLSEYEIRALARRASRPTAGGLLATSPSRSLTEEQRS